MARGRGRGRGGRGNGQKGLTHGRDGKVFFNGVDVTNPSRTFTAGEKRLLDREAWNYIRNRMPGGRYYEGPSPGRGRKAYGCGRGRGREDYQADRQISSANLPEDHETNQDNMEDVKPRVNPGRGTRNGGRFGRGNGGGRN